MRYTYPIILVPADEGGYTVLVPDLPGCITEGDTVEEAIEMAKDAMSGWIEVSLEQKEVVPKPSTLEDTVKKLNETLDGIVESQGEQEKVIITSVQIDIPQAAA